jgi:hypothetical protein
LMINSATRCQSAAVRCPTAMSPPAIASYNMDSTPGIQLAANQPAGLGDDKRTGDQRSGMGLGQPTHASWSQSSLSAVARSCSAAHTYTEWGRTRTRSWQPGTFQPAAETPVGPLCGPYSYPRRESNPGPMD